ncbi:hypothetical protein BD779DRAFT_889315 [Infundibulicybe gibba]|nr:hypothetical protein BD779DRAFT_889315 [Infundibulicybe gibba]
MDTCCDSLRPAIRFTPMSRIRNSDKLNYNKLSQFVATGLTSKQLGFSLPYLDAVVREDLRLTAITHSGPGSQTS